MDKKNKVSDRFREVRHILGDITQEQLAERLLLSRNYIAKIESDRKEPSARVLSGLEALVVDQGHNQGTTLLEEAPPSPFGVLKQPHHQKKSALTAALRREITDVVKSLVDAAGEDPGRLGWIREQLLIQLRHTESWGDSYAAAVEEVLREEREAGAAGRHSENEPKKFGGR